MSTRAVDGSPAQATKQQQQQQQLNGQRRGEENRVVDHGIMLPAAQPSAVTKQSQPAHARGKVLYGTVNVLERVCVCVRVCVCAFAFT